MTSEGELGRVLNAVSATLNDQRPERFDPERIQEIVTQALGGEPHLMVQADPADVASGWLVDEHDTRVARVRRSDGRWEVERTVPARSESPVPSAPPARDKARMQAREGRVPLLAAAGLAIVVFVVMLVVLGIALWICIVAALAMPALAGAGGMMAKQKLSG